MTSSSLWLVVHPRFALAGSWLQRTTRERSTDRDETTSTAVLHVARKRPAERYILRQWRHGTATGTDRYRLCSLNFRRRPSLCRPKTSRTAQDIGGRIPAYRPQHAGPLAMDQAIDTTRQGEDRRGVATVGSWAPTRPTMTQRPFRLTLPAVAGPATPSGLLSAVLLVQRTRTKQHKLIVNPSTGRR